MAGVRRQPAGPLLITLAMVITLASGCAKRPIEDDDRVIRIIGTHGLEPGQVYRPRGIHLVDNEDLFYVVDWSGRIQKFTYDGNYLGGWAMPEVDNGKPEDLCLSIDGNVLVADTHYSRIVEFTPDGELVRTFGSYGTELGQFVYPVGICIDTDGYIYVSEYGGNERIQKFDRDGRFVATWGHFGTAPGEFQRPSGISIGADQLLYVADAINHRVQVFDLDGKLQRTIGQRGKSPGTFTYPYDVAIFEEAMYVVEYGTQRAQKLSLTGTPLIAYGVGGSCRSCLAAPWRLTAGNRGVYVSDTYNHRIIQLDMHHPSGTSTEP